MRSLCMLLLLWGHEQLVHGQQTLSLADANKMGAIVKSFNATWMSDTEFYYETYESILRAFDAKKKTFRVVGTTDILTMWSSAGYSFSPDNKKMLVGFGHEIIKKSIAAKYNIYDLEKKKTYHIAKNNTVRAATWSPSSDKLAFVDKNDVYVWMPDGKEIKLTSTGKDGVVYNGIPDNVYHEEIMPSGCALWFSPDGGKLAIGVFDDTAVTTYPLEMSEDAKPKVTEQRYPYPGTPNPKVKVLIFDLKTPKKISAELVAPKSVGDGHILDSVNWAGNENVVVKWLNRVQDSASFQLCTISGSCKEVLKVEEPTGWVEAKVKECPSKDNCVLLNWIGDDYQIWNMDLSTKKNNFDPVKGIHVHEYYGYKQSTKEMFYEASVPGDTNERQIYKNKECLSCSLKDADGVACKSAKAIFSNDFSFFLLKCGAPKISYEKIYDTKTGKSIYDWELNEIAKSEVSKLLVPKFELIQVPIAGDLKATVKVLYSPKLDKTKKYPLIINIIGTPYNDYALIHEFVLGWPGYLTSGKNFVLAFIEGRGVGNKGKKSLYSIKNKIGIDDVDDQFVILQHVLKKCSFIDPKKVGIMGAAYGGYVAGKAISKDSTKLFKCGILVHPVSDWMYYDSIYSERYFGIPSSEKGKQLYSETSLMHNLTNFRNHEIMVIHGIGHENSHYQNSLKLIEALSSAKIKFSKLTFMNSVPEPSKFFTEMENFWDKCFA